MRLLLDECVPKGLARDSSDHDVSTVPQMGWAGLKNSALLSEAASQFDVLVTTDQNLEFQQNIPSFDIALLVLVAPRNDIDLLRPLVPRALEVLDGARSGHVFRITG